MVVAHTADLDAELLAGSRALLDGVFGDFDESDWEHCLGGVHAVLTDGSQVVGHASIIQRRLIHGGRAVRTGYVEGVAVRRDLRGTGLGAQLMTVMERIVVGAFDLGALGSTDEAVGFYRGRGWVVWQGATWALTPDGVVRTADEDGGVFVFAPPAGNLDLDLDGDLTCDWRPGDVW